MLHKKVYGTSTWINLESPTKDEIEELVSILPIEKSVAIELENPSIRHKVEFSEKHAYLILHFPAFKDSGKDDAAYELDFVVGPDYVITVHYEKVEVIEDLTHSLIIEDTANPSITRNKIFYGILGELLNNLDLKLVEIDHRLRDIEKNMFAGKEKFTIFELSEIARHIIDFKKITAVYPDIFESLEKNGREIFGEDFCIQLESIKERFSKSHNKLERLSDISRDLRETNNSLLTTKQNETMRILTIVFIIMSMAIGAILIWIDLR